MNRRFVSAAFVLTLALSGAAAVMAQDEMPTPEPDQIPLQTVEVNGRRFTVDPYDVMECFPVKRTEELAQSTEGGIEASLQMQCFIRIGSQMTAIEEFPTDDMGVTEAVKVGQAIVSEPQIAVEQDDPGDG